MKVHFYETTRGVDKIREFINSLTERERVDGISVLQNLENDCMELLKIKPWQGKIHELYFYRHNRIFFVAIEGADIYLLHACKKQKNRTEKRDSDIVKKRAKELQNEIKTPII